MAKDNSPRIERKKITDLRQDPSNANVGTERGLRMLDDSIAEAGAGRSGLADRNGILVAGNKTQERLVDRGIEDVIVVHTKGDEWVVVQRDDLDLLNDDPNNTARKLAFFDNRAGELDLQWNAEQLLADLNAGVDLSQFWREDELQALLESILPAEQPPGDPGAAISRAEELREQYGVERGQLWLIGRHRLLCGDAYSAEDVARLLDGKAADMLHIDPPYGISIVQPSKGNSAAAIGGAKPFGSTAPANRKGEAAVAERNSGSAERVHVQHGKPSRNQWAKNHPEYMTIKGDTGATSSARYADKNGLLSTDVGRGNPANIVQSNLYPVIQGDDRPFTPEHFLAHAPIVIMWGANYFADKLPTHACWICWDKREDITRNNFADGELAWTNMDSPMRIFHHLWNGLHKGSQHGERRTHPTEKPVALFEEIGKMFCDKGLWLDLFAGTGAQMVAAERSGATCYANEIEPLYVATILDRLERMGLSPEREG